MNQKFESILLPLVDQLHSVIILFIEKNDGFFWKAVQKSISTKQ